MLRISPATLVLVIFHAGLASALDQTSRFVKACGKPDRDVTVLDSFLPPQRTLFYDRAGFDIVFELPKQPEGPLPASNNRWYWPAVKPPYQWQYDRVDKQGETWACARENHRSVLPH
jgi:hypothetical protein